MQQPHEAPPHGPQGRNRFVPEVTRGRSSSEGHTGRALPSTSPCPPPEAAEAKPRCCLDPTHQVLCPLPWRLQPWRQIRDVSVEGARGEDERSQTRTPDLES